MDASFADLSRNLSHLSFVEATGRVERYSNMLRTGTTAEREERSTRYVIGACTNLVTLSEAMTAVFDTQGSCSSP